MHWYDEYDHIGYNLDGQKINKPKRFGQLRPSGPPVEPKSYVAVNSQFDGAADRESLTSACTGMVQQIEEGGN